MPDNEVKLDVRVYPIDEPKGSTVAFASVGIDLLLAIRGVRVVSGENGFFVAMPQSKDKDGGYHDIAFPLTAGLRRDITDAVLDEFDAITSIPREDRVYEARDMSAVNERSADDVKLDVRVYPFAGQDSSTKAYASVGIGGLAAIRGLRVVEGEKGLFVAMPQSKDSEGAYHDVAFPLSGSLRKGIEREVLDGYAAAGLEASRKLSIGDGLREGAAKAAEYAATSRAAPARAYSAGVLE